MASGHERPIESKQAKRYLPVACFAVFAMTWIVLAIEPRYPEAWLYENIVIALFAPIVIWSYFRFRLSDTSYCLIFVFAMLHIFAAHYTYADTPWGHRLADAFGTDRNHFDRIVHFLYGLFTIPIFADLFSKYLPGKKMIAALFLLAISVAVGAIYEIGEFVAGAIGDPGVGFAFLGFQGDVWDTQKDMALQGIGALFSIMLWMILSSRDPVEKL